MGIQQIRQHRLKGFRPAIVTSEPLNKLIDGFIHKRYDGIFLIGKMLV